MAGFGQIKDDPGRRIEGIRINGVNSMIYFQSTGLSLLYCAGTLNNLEDLKMGAVEKIDQIISHYHIMCKCSRSLMISDFQRRSRIGDIEDVQADLTTVTDINRISTDRHMIGHFQALLMESNFHRSQWIRHIDNPEPSITISNVDVLMIRRYIRPHGFTGCLAACHFDHVGWIRDIQHIEAKGAVRGEQIRPGDFDIGHSKSLIGEGIPQRPVIKGYGLIYLCHIIDFDPSNGTGNKRIVAVPFHVEGGT